MEEVEVAQGARDRQDDQAHDEERSEEKQGIHSIMITKPRQSEFFFSSDDVL